MNSKSFKETIEKSSSVLIISHVNPDGDTLGTMCALYQIIKNNFNKNPEMVFNGVIPDIYHFLPNINQAKTPQELKGKVYDLAIAVDIAAIDRMGDSLPLFKNAKVRMNIDHHKTNKGYGDINFVRGDACCAGEVLFDIVKNLNLKTDKATADCFYTAFLTDTGGFRYENTNANVLKKSAELVEWGAVPAEISGYCYESKPKNMVLFHAHCMMNAQFENDNKIAYTLISNKDMEKFHAKNDYTEGIVEELRRMNSTEVSFVLKEVDENTTKASLRSKSIDVSVIADVFGGGGHKFAAGCTIRKPLSIACDKMLDEIRKKFLIDSHPELDLGSVQSTDSKTGPQ